MLTLFTWVFMFSFVRSMTQAMSWLSDLIGDIVHPLLMLSLWILSKTLITFWYTAPHCKPCRYVWVAITPFTLILGLKSGVFWNPLIISFPMSTETFWLSPKMTEKIGFKECWGPKSLSGWPEFFKAGWATLHSIFSSIFGDNHKVSVLIGKLMMRGFQNTPDFNPSINVKGVIATQT